jgi:hypothetical protein
MAYQRRALFAKGDPVRHWNGGSGRVVGVTTVYVYDVVWDENMFPRKGTYDERDLSAETPIRASAGTRLNGSRRRQSYRRARLR